MNALIIRLFSFRFGFSCEQMRSVSLVFASWPLLSMLLSISSVSFSVSFFFYRFIENTLKLITLIQCRMCTQAYNYATRRLVCVCLFFSRVRDFSLSFNESFHCLHFNRLFGISNRFIWCICVFAYEKRTLSCKSDG